MEIGPSIQTELQAISATDWEATPAIVRQLLQRLIDRIEQQSEQISALQAENARLQEQVGRNSANSSQPPSEDKGFKVSRKGKSGRSRGAQPGHAGHERFLYAVEDCLEVHDHYPERCDACGALLCGHDPSPYRHQIVELPPLLPEVVEHRFHALVCPG